LRDLVRRKPYGKEGYDYSPITQSKPKGQGIPRKTIKNERGASKDLRGPENIRKT